MNKLMKLALMGSLALGLFAVGCGDDESTNVLGLDGSKKLSDLTDADAVTACESYAAWSLANATSLEVNCTVVALAYTSDVDSCTSTRAACIAEGSGTIEPTDCSDASADDVPDCDVTVDEYSACVVAMADSNVDFATSLSCEDAGTEISYPGEPAACTTLYAACPELDPETDGSSTPAE